MKRMFSVVVVSAILWCSAALIAPFAHAVGEADAKGKFSALMFGDLYWVQGHHTDKYKGQNGLWFRRINFTYDYDIDEEFSARFRLEAANDDFTKAAAAMTPFVKDAFLEMEIPAHPWSPLRLVRQPHLG